MHINVGTTFPSYTELEKICRSSKLSPLKTKKFLASNPTITLVAIDPHMAIIQVQIGEKIHHRRYFARMWHWNQCINIK
jgi:hypothetical protein